MLQHILNTNAFNKCRYSFYFEIFCQTFSLTLILIQIFRLEAKKIYFLRCRLIQTLAIFLLFKTFLVILLDVQLVHIVLSCKWKVVSSNQTCNVEYRFVIWPTPQKPKPSVTTFGEITAIWQTFVPTLAFYNTRQIVVDAKDWIVILRRTQVDCTQECHLFLTLFQHLTPL